MKPVYLTLQQISDRILSELVRSRTDFLLLQAQVWKSINNSVQDGAVFVQPNTLDLDTAKFEFFISGNSPTLLEKIRLLLSGIPGAAANRFRLCNQNEKNGIKVTISLERQSGSEMLSKISTEPELESKPENTYISGLQL